MNKDFLEGPVGDEDEFVQSSDTFNYDLNRMIRVIECEFTRLPTFQTAEEVIKYIEENIK